MPKKKTDRLSVRMTPEQIDKIHKASKSLGITISGLVTMVLDLECDFILDDARIKHRNNYFNYDFLIKQFRIVRNHMSKTTLTSYEQALAWEDEAREALEYLERHPNQADDLEVVKDDSTGDILVVMKDK